MRFRKHTVGVDTCYESAKGCYERRNSRTSQARITRIASINSIPTLGPLVGHIVERGNGGTGCSHGKITQELGAFDDGQCGNINGGGETRMLMRAG